MTAGEVYARRKLKGSAVLDSPNWVLILENLGDERWGQKSESSEGRGFRGGCLVVTYLRECDNDDHVDLYPWIIESWIGWMLLVR